MWNTLGRSVLYIIAKKMKLMKICAFDVIRRGGCFREPVNRTS